VADHIRRSTIDFSKTHLLVVDEYDKSLEIGFEEEMAEIFENLAGIKKAIFTSATSGIQIPEFAKSGKIEVLDFLDFQKPDYVINRVVSPSKDKLESLFTLLCELGESSGIVFCNFKDSIDRISDFLSSQKISHECFHGNLDQIERERALIKFRNGTARILLATDLAARGIDIPDMNYIIHYHLPTREEEFTHRNGRTARMKADGQVFVMHWENDEVPEFIKGDEHKVSLKSVPPAPDWCTVFLSGGRKDKISKGDIAGLFFKEGQLSKNHVGLIELKSDCAFIAVHKSKVNQLIRQVDNTRLKTKKVRISLV
jgi:superfamily II DNA/RNA helicase